MGCVKSVSRYALAVLIVPLSVTWQVGRMMLSTLLFLGLLFIWYWFGGHSSKSTGRLCSLLVLAFYAVSLFW